MFLLNYFSYLLKLKGKLNAKTKNTLTMKGKILIISTTVLLITSISINIYLSVSWDNDRASLLRLLSKNREEFNAHYDQLRDETYEEIENYARLLAECDNELNQLSKQIERDREIQNSGIEYKALEKLAIHTGFSESNAILGYVPKGAVVRVKDSNFNMWKISYQDMTGWVITKTGYSFGNDERPTLERF